MARKLWIIGFIFLYSCCFPSLGWTDYTNSKLVTLVISAIDQVSGMGAGAEMRFSNDGLTWSEPEPFATLRQNWDLTAYGGGTADGTKTVYARFKDSAGNWVTDQISDSIILELDTDNDGMPDAWETEYGLNPNVDDANQDNDQDGYTNLEEYLAGWNPTHYALTIYVNDDAPSGGDGTAELPFNTILQAIEQAIDADTILVLGGNYLESQGLLMKERVDLVSEPDYLCTIDLNGSGFIEGASYSTILGFKIINPLNNMGAISCLGTSPTIHNNIIIPSTNGAAGILLTDSSTAKIVNNTILDAYIGIEIDSASPTIRNNIIVDNILGIMMYSGDPVIDYNNVWGNTGTQPCLQGDYCGATPGTHDISADPRFVDPVVEDYHLRVGSPCIDTGSAADAPLDDIDGDSRPQGAGYDIGADEFVPQASATPIITLYLNKSSFTTGEKITVSVDITAPESSIVVDFYISLQLPDGTVYYYPYWSTFSTPLLRSWEVVDLSTTFFDDTFKGDELGGEYTWDARFVEQETNNVIGQPSSVSFTFSP